MKLSFSTLGCPDWSFSDIVATARDLGYDGVEIHGVANQLDGSKISQFLPENAEKTKALLAQKKLEIPILTSTCYINDKNIAEETMEKAGRYIDTAQRMGIKYVRVLCDYGPEQSGQLDDAYIAGQLKTLTAKAGGQGVGLLVETNGYYANSTRLVKLIDSVGADNLGVLWDIHHPYRYFGETPEFTVGTLGDLIRHVHMKDSIVEDGKLKYRLLSQGDLPIRDCVEKLEGIGYTGYYSLEWLKRWDLSLEEPGIAFASYASFMQDLL